MSRQQHILLVNLYSNGDCLYATAIARQIKHDYPGCHLTWAVASFCKGVLEGNPYIDDVWVIDTVQKNDIIAFRKLRREIAQQKANGKWEEVFFTAAMDDNQMYYDGTIRTNIFHSYPHPITEGIQPVLHFTPAERSRVDGWAIEKKLSSYRQVVLFEFAPQSGQMNLTKDEAVKIAEDLCATGNIAVILSSAQKIDHSNPAVMDGSELTFRESVYLSNHCTLLLGSSSGITWGTTADGGKMLPMVQLLNPWTVWANPISRDFERQGIPTDELIELTDFDRRKVVDCITMVFEKGFAAAKAIYSQPIPLHFKTTRRIVYNLLCYRQFGAIKKHLQLNAKTFGWKPALIKEAAIAILGFPFRLVYNKIRKSFPAKA